MGQNTACRILYNELCQIQFKIMTPAELYHAQIPGYMVHDFPQYLHVNWQVISSTLVVVPLLAMAFFSNFRRCIEASDSRRMIGTDHITCQDTAILCWRREHTSGFRNLHYDEYPVSKVRQ